MANDRYSPYGQHDLALIEEMPQLLHFSTYEEQFRSESHILIGSYEIPVSQMWL
jgi:hypothetical protein